MIILSSLPFFELLKIAQYDKNGEKEAGFSSLL
jgi:hypothetical protein